MITPRLEFSRLLLLDILLTNVQTFELVSTLDTNMFAWISSTCSIKYGVQTLYVQTISHDRAEKRRKKILLSFGHYIVRHIYFHFR